MSLPPVLGSSLNILRITGVGVGGVMLMVFVLILMFRLVEDFAPFLGLFNLFRRLRCGESS